MQALPHLHHFGMLLWCFQDYKAAQKVAAEKEAQYLPKVPPAPALSAIAASSSGAAAGTEADIESQALLQQQKLLDSRAMENTVAFQEALIEERDHGIAGERSAAQYLRRRHRSSTGAVHNPHPRPVRTCSMFCSVLLHSKVVAR